MTHVVQDLLATGPAELVRQFEAQLGDAGDDRVGGQLIEDLLGGADHVRGERGPPRSLGPQGAFVAAVRVVPVPGPGHGGGAVERDDHPAERDPPRPSRLFAPGDAPVFIDQGELGGRELVAGLAGDDVAGQQVQPVGGRPPDRAQSAAAVPDAVDQARVVRLQPRPLDVPG